jgi:hypothetical protein
MATNTEKRILMTLTMPQALETILAKERAFADCSMATLMRRITKWHRGEGAGRHQDAPTIKRSKRIATTRVTKSFLVDEEDVAYLDKLGAEVGVPRITALLMVIYQWLDIDVFAPRGSK